MAGRGKFPAAVPSMNRPFTGASVAPSNTLPAHVDRKGFTVIETRPGRGAPSSPVAGEIETSRWSNVRPCGYHAHPPGGRPLPDLGLWTWDSPPGRFGGAAQSGAGGGGVGVAPGKGKRAALVRLDGMDEAGTLGIQENARAIGMVFEDEAAAVGREVGVALDECFGRERERCRHAVDFGVRHMDQPAGDPAAGAAPEADEVGGVHGADGVRAG